MKSVFYVLQNTLENCSPSEKCIAEYILKNSRAVLTMKISDLAQAGGGSTAAVIRLCKRLHINGFTELKNLLAKDVYSDAKTTETTEYLDFTFTKKESIQNIQTKLLSMNVSNLAHLKKTLDYRDIEKTVQAILSARFIHLAGVGASSIAALDLHQKFLRIGMLSGLEMDSHLQLTTASTLKKEDVALFFSYSGETTEIIQGADLAKKNGAFTIAITRLGVSSLSKICDVTIHLPDTEAINRYGAILSKINQLIIVDIIYTGIITNHLEQSFTNIEKTRIGVAKNYVTF